MILFYKKCPKCKKRNNVYKIIYGLPTIEFFEKPSKDRIVSGGCCIGPEKWYCETCDVYFR